MMMIDEVFPYVVGDRGVLKDQLFQRVREQGLLVGQATEPFAAIPAPLIDGAEQVVNRDPHVGTLDQRPVDLEGDPKFIAPQAGQFVEECSRTVATHVQQNEDGLSKAFAAFDPDKVHFAILGDWVPDVHVLVRRDADRKYLLGLEIENGTLDGKPCLNAFYVSISETSFEVHDSGSGATRDKGLLATVREDALRMFPINFRRGVVDYLKPRPDSLRTITIECDYAWPLTSEPGDFEELLLGPPNVYRIT